jgi:hypothetical protein
MNNNTEAVSIEFIGKKEALSILDNNTINRKITRANVEFIKNEIVSNKFKVNGATIVISSNNMLLDGQHRLTAIAELNIVLPLLVVRGVDNDIFSTIDTGKSRTAGDVFSSKKIKNANNLASAVKRIMEGFGSTRNIIKTGTMKISNAEIFNFYTEHQEKLDRYIEFCTHLYCVETKILTPSVTTAMMFLLAREDEQKSRSFIREIYSGNKEYDSNAAQTLRKRLLNSKIDGITFDDSHLRAFFIIAFRAYKEGRDLSMIKISNPLPSYVFKQD